MLCVVQVGNLLDSSTQLASISLLILYLKKLAEQQNYGLVQDARTGSLGRCPHYLSSAIVPVSNWGTAPPQVDALIDLCAKSHDHLAGIMSLYT